ncbi:hypothetical protein L6164_013958 [Bauhinia variegata]|uniref:Uncharacterized protein n=1 Tax=Bauhinia variegata TaxID=167791 RepID=A0ACB9NH86_BAUVA|nr:hypothetical protein L6164_013958 [Bauhinia variegata]
MKGYFAVSSIEVCKREGRSALGAMDNNLMRLQEFDHNNHWREIPEMLAKLLTLLFAIVALKNADGGEDFFKANHSVIMAFVLAVVVYFLASVLQLQIRNFLPITIVLLLGSLASVLAVAILSLTIASITLALWLTVFALVAYFKKREVSAAVRNWIGRDENLPVTV